MNDVLLTNNKSKPLRVICISGGKGGIGKTTVAVNLAIAFAQKQKKVLLFDADLGLANVDIRLGLSPARNLHHVVMGECEINDICMAGPHGIKVIPSSSGIAKMAELTPGECNTIINSFSNLATDLDVMIIDMAPGISSQVIDFTHAAQDILVVICNDPASLMDSYAIIKILHQKYARKRFGVIVNKVKHLQEGYDVFTKFQKVIAKFINVSMHYIGHVPQDDYISMSAREGFMLMDKFPQAPAALAFNQISHGIDCWQDDATLAGGIHYFFERLFDHTTAAKDKPCTV
jgi:flagellar biosynthesis protein FlhG